MIITREQVDYVARLARLTLEDEERELYTEQLNAIFEYAQALDHLDTQAVEPMAHVLPVHNVFREDVTGPSLDREDVLLNAPDPIGEFFKVPRIV